jgi:hypothetical protein
MEASSSGSNTDAEQLEGSFDAASAPVEETPEERSAQLRQMWEAEQFDARWAGTTEASLTSMFGHTDFAGFRLLEASCRTSMCRVVVARAHDGPASRQRDVFQNALVKHSPNDLAMWGRAMEGQEELYYFRPEVSTTASSK